MSFKFNIQETIEKELSYGYYSVYILGGHHIDANPDFYIQIINIETNKDVDLKEKSLKLRDFKFGKKAVKFYSFEIMKHGKFKISVHNYYDIIVKDFCDKVIKENNPSHCSIRDVCLTKRTKLARNKLDEVLEELKQKYDDKK